MRRRGMVAGLLRGGITRPADSEECNMIPVTLTVHNPLPIARPREGISAGVPLARGHLRDPAAVRVFGPDDRPLPSQARAQCLWGDGSVRWLMVHFLADLPASGNVRLRVGCDSCEAPLPALPLRVRDEITRAAVDTGALRFAIDGATFRGLEKVKLPGRGEGQWVAATLAEEQGSLQVRDAEGRLYTALCGRTRRLLVEERGPVHFSACIEGELADESGRALLDYELWISAFAGQSIVRMLLTLRNGRASRRRVLGQWPLGLPGSVYFREAGWTVTPAQDGVAFVTLHSGGLSHYPLAQEPAMQCATAGAGEVYRGPIVAAASLVQDSSGGEHWFHRNHVNRQWRIPLSWRGWKAFVDGREIAHGDRAGGFAAVEDPRIGVAMGVRHFWQNFPKALRAVRRADGKVSLCAALWPGEFADVHEMQGGEQKTHELVVNYFRGDAGRNVPVPYNQWPETAAAMYRALNPPIVLASSQHYAASHAFDYLAAYDAAETDYELVNEGSLSATPANLLTQREFFDEYGWRNFGDVVADCEVAGRVLSHYNLEYDMGYAMLMQAARTADARPELALEWWRLAEAALRHEADIDCYHTSEDRHTDGAYCHGKHHHTEHAYEAGRSTHRAYEEDGLAGDLVWYWHDERGGGPESQHMNTRGMLTYGWMADYPPAIRAAQAMADLIVWKIEKDRFAQIGSYFRDSGHNLQILNDAWHLTGERKYLETGAVVIDRGHPDRQPWQSGFPAEGELNCWGGSIFLKEIARYIEIHEAEGWELPQRALSAILCAVEIYNRWAWDEGLSRYAHVVRRDGTHFRYDEPWWDLKILEMVAWACRWQTDAAVRKLWLSRARRNFDTACRMLTGGARKPVYHNCKCSTVTAQNGPAFLALEAMFRASPGARGRRKG